MTHDLTNDFAIKIATVNGTGSAHRPQCTHRSSSLTITRPVCFNGADTYKA